VRVLAGEALGRAQIELCALHVLDVAEEEGSA
jgi:hypothetical protein